MSSEMMTSPEQPSPQHRGIVSFVRRSQKLDRRLQKAWDTHAPHYLLDIPHEDKDLTVAHDFHCDADFVREHWGVEAPLIVEIGTGQGENIVAAARNNPNTLFLGLEVYEPGVAHALLMAGRDNLENLRIAQINAPELLQSMSDNLLQEVWTYFPDPWPKKKHHKRRIVQSALAEEVHRVLQPNGVWRIATDIDDYALHVHEIMDNRNDFKNMGTRTVSLHTQHVGKGNAELADELPHGDFIESERFAGRVITSFEHKALEAQRTIHDFTYQAQ